ncbi:ERF family ssDNA binding protein [Microbacterium phage Teamocil]|uniref:ERF family ssDNA binding protein n=1 Tax=Microbacterium phage Teamocil TaxID=2656554 RepID=A0A649VYF9_9CAUD|nr:ERF family ssDNA binding protein [Microbacterium phage Teamocil]QGJ88905.1 ERF family ssDNA binding protein [Microbacterium phage Gina]QGJ97002.1 ERF family ssDNA binding protein [Microbacterium phage Teamocil]
MTDVDPSNYPNLATALAAFQAHIPAVRKGNTAKVEGSRGSYSYDYADLADVTDVALPALAAVGLAWITRPDTSEDGTIEMHYSLVHAATGESIEGSVAVGRKGDRWQDLGSALTYARRYMLVSVTGIAPGGDDNDGQDARAGAAPVAEPVKQYLPVGLYDLSEVKTRKAAESMFYVARGAGHLGLYVQTPSGDEVMFGDWLRATGAKYPEVEPEDESQDADAATGEVEMTDEEKAEAAERAAIEAHEAELAKAEADRDDTVEESNA